MYDCLASSDSPRGSVREQAVNDWKKSVEAVVFSCRIASMESIMDLTLEWPRRWERDANRAAEKKVTLELATTTTSLQDRWGG